MLRSTAVSDLLCFGGCFPRGKPRLNYQYLIKDLFEEITEFSNRTLAARATKRPDGTFNVAIDVDAHKFTADDKGNETEVPVDDWIEIGAFAKPPKDQKYGKVLHRERIHMTKSGKASYQFVTAGEPDKAGIDPFLMLIDRVPVRQFESGRYQPLTAA